MIPEDQRNKLENTGKLKVGRVTVLQKGKEPEKPKKDPLEELVKSLKEAIQSNQEQTVAQTREIAKNIRAVQDRKIDIGIPKDQEIADLIKKLPGMITELISALDERYSRLMTDMIYLIQVQSELKEWDFKVTGQNKYGITRMSAKQIK